MPAGFGPADGPDGLFFGKTVGQNEVYAIDSAPVGVTVQAFAGGMMKLTVAANAPTGNGLIGFTRNSVAGTYPLTIT